MTAQPPPTPKQENDIGEDPIVLGLRKLYDSVLSEPIPHDFMAILTQIDVSIAETAEKPTLRFDDAASSAVGAPNGQGQ